MNSVAKPRIPVNVPPELHPDFVPPRLFPREENAICGQDISKDQVNKNSSGFEANLRL
jgi:hypothetical protein